MRVDLLLRGTSPNVRMTPPIALRDVEEKDEAFVFELFRGANEGLVSAAPDASLELLEMQFAAQRRGYSEQYPEAQDHIVTVADLDVGRILVWRTQAQIRIVDVCLLPECRGAGIGSALLGMLQEESAREGKPLRLSVLKTNPARRLYERLGFATLDETATHVHMESVPA